MGNRFFNIGEEKAENGVDVADAFRRLAEELRGNPNAQEARQKAVGLLRRKDIVGVLGEKRIDWLKKDLENLNDTESIQTFLQNTSRFMEKEGIAQLSWEQLSKYLGQLDQPQECTKSEMDLSKGTAPLVPDDEPGDSKQRPSKVAAGMPDDVKLKTGESEEPLADIWREMDAVARTKAAQSAGFNEVEARELAKLAWEGLDPSIKKDLEWVLRARPGELSGQTETVGPEEEVDETVEDLAEMCRKDMKDAIANFAAARAAEQWSTATDGMKEQFGADVHTVAQFGDWTAVNGELIQPGRDLPPVPYRFTKTDFGGEVDPQKIEVPMESVTDFLVGEMKYPEELVAKIIAQEELGDHAACEIGGKTEVYASVEPMLTESVNEADRSEVRDLHQKMQDVAKKAVPDAEDFDVEAAIYWFASDNYSGMGDPLYGIVSTSKFNPGPTHRSVADEGEVAQMIYDALKDAGFARESVAEAQSWTAPDGVRFSVQKRDGEWQVVAVKDGRRDDDKTYFTGGGDPDHKKDAEGTLQHMMRHYGKQHHGEPQHENEPGSIRRLPPRLDPKTKRAINTQLGEMSRKYWPAVPAHEIVEMLKDFQIEADPDIIVHRDQGRTTLKMFKGGEEVANSQIVLSWYKMPVSGNYEITAYASE